MDHHHPQSRINLDHLYERYDLADYLKQQKEIENSLSVAFDEVSQLSDISINDEELINNDDRHFKQLNVNNVDSSELTNNLLNNTSTPIRKNAYENCNTSDDDENSSKPHHLGYNHRSLKPCHFDKDQISNSLLLENDKLSKQMSMLEGKCAKIDFNYKSLEVQFQQLINEKKKYLTQIDQMQLEIEMLQTKLDDERRQRENLSKREIFLESQIDSLEESLSEHRKSDFITRSNDTQEKMLNSLKLKHEKEINALRTEIDELNQKLIDKDDDQMAKTESYRQKFEMIRSNLKKEMKEQMDKENKIAKEKYRTELMKSFDQTVIDLKNDWQQQLNNDVAQIIDWIEINMRADDNFNHEQLSNISVKYEPLRLLCQCLQSSVNERDSRIQMQIYRFRESKQQLEEILLESKMSVSNISSNNSDKGQLMYEDFKMALNKINEENKLINHKLTKYKTHYYILEKKHRQEVESLNNKISKLERELTQNCSPNGKFR